MSAHPQTWSSDSAEAVDLLVEACSKAAQPKAPVLPHLIGRQLTPYFGSCEPAQGATSGKSKQRKATGKAAPKPAADVDVEPQPQPARPKAAAPTRSCSPPSGAAAKGPSRALGAPAGAAVSSTSGAYSCPGMFTSPKPDALPTPSSSLLLRACHQAAAQRTAVVA